MSHTAGGVFDASATLRVSKSSTGLFRAAKGRVGAFRVGDACWWTREPPGHAQNSVPQREIRKGV